MKKPKDIDEYISSYPREIQKLLEQFRATIKKAAPKAEEVISYGMPAFKFKGMLVWFAAHSKHIGFYPRVSAIERFKKELSVYKAAKGSVQFPLDKPLPLGLISKIVKFRVQEDLQRAKKYILSGATITNQPNAINFLRATGIKVVSYPLTKTIEGINA